MVARSVTCTPIVGGAAGGASSAVVAISRAIAYRNIPDLEIRDIRFTNARTDAAGDGYVAELRFKGVQSPNVEPYCRSGFPQFNDQCLGQSAQDLAAASGGSSVNNFCDGQLLPF